MLALFDQPFELVVDVLYLFAGEQVRLADAGDALDELADLAVERGAVAAAGLLEPVTVHERLEHAEGIKRAGDRGAPIGEPGVLERVLEHGEVEARVSDARDAIDFAANAIDEAQYAMLDAILARKDASVLAETYSVRHN
jgi:hypothetical protein